MGAGYVAGWGALPAGLLGIINKKGRMMLIKRDFTSSRVTLSFDTGKRIELTRDETKEFDKRILEIQKEAFHHPPES